MSLSLPAGPDARRRPSHLKGFLRLLPFLLAAMGLAWLALDGLVFRESARHMRDLERVSAIHRNYCEATEAAGLLKAGSDALTQAVRRYAATGRPSFLHAYEQEEHADRHRERALEIIERMPGADDAARRMLRTAMEESLALQDVEHRAMRLVAEATGMPRDGMPEHLRAIVLSPDEEAMLKRAGVPEVVTAPSAADALEALEKHGAFDLVLTDLWMPEMDGYALCARIRADDRWKALRVYAVTADVEARKTVADRGFDGILLKPLTADALSRFLAGLRPSA